jgi:hypothetical protein
MLIIYYRCYFLYHCVSYHESWGDYKNTIRGMTLILKTQWVLGWSTAVGEPLQFSH